MDKVERKRFDWLAAEMPRVVVLLRERRKADGAAHVNECWRRGVLLGEPGWFFAREGAVAVGTPDSKWSWPELDGLPNLPGQALLLMKDREAHDGAQ